ncbi:MAG TPA: tetratricopeptide repeat protein [Anaerolineaceae bacterium]|nr:tetratricopeptide repeat protein [Anaerolineaceae bacterium]HPN53781.1 tetratricopeptide repeat protein [Anaerolineaceae bacterium]
MSPSDRILNISEENFEYEVLEFSQTMPVLVEFWATWCIPCKVLDPLLEELSTRYEGVFRVTRLDVDRNPTLVRKLGVRNLPVVKSFVNGEVNGEFSGPLDEAHLWGFISRTIPDEGDLTLNKAENLLVLKSWQDARVEYTRYLEGHPNHPRALLGLAKCLLATGDWRQARQLLQNFPASPEYKTAEILLPLADALNTEDPFVDDGKDELAPMLSNSLRLVKKGKIEPAVDGLLELLRMNKRYKQGSVRLMVLGLLELMGEEDPQTRQYRTELATILFQ